MFRAPGSARMRRRTTGQPGHMSRSGWSGTRHVAARDWADVRARRSQCARAHTALHVARRDWLAPTDPVGGCVARCGRDLKFGRILDGRHVSGRTPTVFGRPNIGV